MGEKKRPEGPEKKDAAWFIKHGLIWVGFVGGFISCVSIKFVQGMVSVDNPLNQKFKEAPVWVPGTFLVVGPLLGLAYYAIFAKDAGDVEE